MTVACRAVNDKIKNGQKVKMRGDGEPTDGRAVSSKGRFLHPAKALKVAGGIAPRLTCSAETRNSSSSGEPKAPIPSLFINIMAHVGLVLYNLFIFCKLLGHREFEVFSGDSKGSKSSIYCTFISL